MEHPELLKADTRKRSSIKGIIQWLTAGVIVGVVGSLVFQKTVYAEEPPINPYKAVIENMTDEERDLLLSVTWYEANNQCTEGQRGVIEVILNRTISEDPYWPDTVYGVLSQKGQFATWRFAKRNPHHYGQDQLDALQLVYEEAPILPDLGYLYFSRGRFRWCTRNVRIQDHIFGGV